MTTLVVIQARTGSQRFPRKVLADLNGRPVLAHVVERAKAIRGVDRVVLACPEADWGAIHGFHLGVEIVAYTSEAGENDVLSRFAEALRRFPARTCLRITADCPFLAPDVAEEVAALVHPHAPSEDDPVYAATRCDGAYLDSWPWPDGMDVEAFRAGGLLEAELLATDPGDREHVTPAIRRDWRCQFVYPEEVWPPCKLSIDTPADLDFARAVMARIPAGQFGWEATWEAVNALREPTA